MRHSQQPPQIHALTLSALLLVLLSASGCGETRNVALSHPVPTLAVVTAGPTVRGVTAYSAAIQVPENSPRIHVSASCPAGAQMIGGGFAATSVFEVAASVSASYPSGPNTWTAVAGSTSFAFNIEADVYCLATPSSLGVQIIRAFTAPTSGSGCPTGSVPLSSGFDYLSDDSSGQFYVLCATRHVSADPMITTRYNPHTSTHSYYPGSVTLACPSSQIAISGDSSGGQVLVSRSAGAPYNSWSFTVGADSDLTLTVRCVSLT